MPFALRIPMILGLWVLCLGGIRSMHHGTEPGFAEFQPGKRPAVPALFFTETINPDQGLPMVHVAAAVQTGDGVLHCVWYGGSAECHPDVRIYLSQKESAGKWTAPRAIMTREQAERDLGRPVRAVGNALLVPERGDSLRLLFVTIAMGKWSGSQLNSCVSKDGGITWSRAERLTLSPFFNLSELVRNRPVTLLGGGWCVPVYQEFLGKFPELLWLGKDASLRKTRIAGGCTSFQPSLIPTGRRTAVAMMRDYTPARRIHLARSENSGLSWSRPAATSLPNPDAGISGLQLSDGSLLVAYNHSPENRTDLSLALSRDQGASWTRLVSLQREEKASFSYPYLMRQSDGLIRLAYTWKGRELRLITFNETWLDAQAATLRP